MSWTQTLLLMLRTNNSCIRTHICRCPPLPLDPEAPAYRGGRHVFAAVGDLRLVGVVGTADHRTRGWEAVASHHTTTGLTRRHPALPQLPVTGAGRAPLGVHDGHGGPAFVVEDSRAQTHSYKEYSASGARTGHADEKHLPESSKRRHSQKSLCRRCLW